MDIQTASDVTHVVVETPETMINEGLMPSTVACEKPENAAETDVTHKLRFQVLGLSNLPLVWQAKFRRFV